MTATRRRGFSLLELIVIMVILSLLAVAAVAYYHEDEDVGLVARARMELSGFAKHVQGSCLNAPRFHFNTLAEALGAKEPPLDPWGRPYVLLHGGFPYAFFQAKGWVGPEQRILVPAAEVGPLRTLETHWIVSSGPDDTAVAGLDMSALDPGSGVLAVPVKLGLPKNHPAYKAPLPAMEFG